jgi:hypothetical protein
VFLVFRQHTVAVQEREEMADRKYYETAKAVASRKGMALLMDVIVLVSRVKKGWFD